MIMEQNIVKVWIDDKAVYIKTDKGDVYSEQFSDYPRLCDATTAVRAKFEYDNIGILWEELDEDLCYAGFMRNPAQIPCCAAQ